MSSKFSFTNERISIARSHKRSKSNNMNRNLKKRTNSKLKLDLNKVFIYNFGNNNNFKNVSNLNFNQIDNTNKDQIIDIEDGEYETYYYTSGNLIYKHDKINNNTISLKNLEISLKYNISKISCGCNFTFILTNKGEIFSWGENTKGQLGLGNNINFLTPQKVNSISYSSIFNNNYKSEDNFIALLNENEIINDISCGSMHILVSSNMNRIFSCGFGETFALGNDKNKSINNFEEIEFFSKPEISRNTIKKLSAGITHSGCIIGEQLYIWGIHILKKDLINKTPTLIKNFEKSNYGVTDLYLGDLLTVILNTKGEISVMGNNNFGQLADNNLETYFSKLTKIILPYPIDYISCGANHILAVSHYNNKVIGWGSNNYSQLNPFDYLKFYTKPTELTWLKNIVPYNIICGKYSTNIISSIEFINKTDKNLNYEELEKNHNSLINKSNKIKDENKKLKEKINDLEHTIKYLEQNTNNLNSEIKISELEDSNDVMNMFKKQLKNDKTIKPQFEIDFNEIKLEKKISEGGFGVIWKGKWRESLVAVKILKHDLMKEETIKDFLYEIKAMESLRHPNIVMFLGQCTKLPNLCIVLEYCVRKSLWYNLQKKEIKLSWNDKKRIALEIAKGMNYLHKFDPPIIHRDLKSLNILIDDGFRPKIADFGWTRLLSYEMTPKIGTFQWMAPEVIKTKTYTEKCDIFSFAIILWEIASREPPFRNMNGTTVALKVMNNELRPIIPENTPRLFKDLMIKCWDQIPEKRPSFKQIVNELENMSFNN